jgi:hypothetical protein
LSSINEELIDSHERIMSLEQQLREATKWAWLLGSLCALRLLLYVVGMILYTKGVKVPRWVDILL